MIKNGYKLFIAVIMICFLNSTIFAGAVITKFIGETKSNKVVIKWTSTSEINCKEYQIERSLDQKSFYRIGTVEALGNSSADHDYEYEDITVFRTTANTFYYRIKIVDKDGAESFYSEIVSVTPSISGVRHTWGSIKALFR